MLLNVNCNRKKKVKKEKKKDQIAKKHLQIMLDKLSNDTMINSLSICKQLRTIYLLQLQKDDNFPATEAIGESINGKVDEFNYIKNLNIRIIKINRVKIKKQQSGAIM